MNVTGMPGHNRGKVYIRGVGYRWPNRPEVPPRVCDGCGQARGISRVTVVSVRPIKTVALCAMCAEEEKGEMQP